MTESDISEKIRSIAISNAAKFKGKPNPGAVLGKLLSQDPDLKKEISEIKPKVMEICKEVSSLSYEDIMDLVEDDAEDSTEKPVKSREDALFGFIKVDPGQKVTTAFPPEPSKYPHIGHAKAITLNYNLAKHHDGKFILRFEDTNPTLAKKDFYEIHEKNYRWLGIEPDEIAYASDYMDKYYEYATQLVESGDAYVCTCDGDTIKKGRMEGTGCPCRELSAEENMKRWQGMFVLEQGKAVLRMKIDMAHQNTTMRDPAIMRAIDHEHVRKGKEYRLWPTYDFENSIMDGIQGITHRLRTKEFELRNELQRYIQKKLDFNPTKIYEFARFNMEGVESSGRVIRELIQSSKLLGWDDPRLTTIVALQRRGFTAEAIKRFVLSTGISKAESTLTWDDLVIINKRILDNEANRYFFVDEPVEIEIKDMPEKTVEIPLHPDDPSRGVRKLEANGRFYLSKKDYDSLEFGCVYRLIDCVNFMKTEQGFSYHSETYDEYKESKGRYVIHWVPAETDIVSIKVLMNDATVIKGFAENSVKDIKEGDVIQFSRFGFCRLDKVSDDMVFWYTHG